MKNLWNIAVGTVTIAAVIAVFVEFNITHILLLCILLAVATPKGKS
jgi:hypothetical protein